MCEGIIYYFNIICKQNVDPDSILKSHWGGTFIILYILCSDVIKYINTECFARWWPLFLRILIFFLNLLSYLHPIKFKNRTVYTTAAMIYIYVAQNQIISIFSSLGNLNGLNLEKDYRKCLRSILYNIYLPRPWLQLSGKKTKISSTTEMAV